jgi:hypothetical protein
MTTNHTTAAPRFTTKPILKEIDTENKTTQGKTFFRHYAAKDFTIYGHYGYIQAYKVGDEVNLERCNGNFTLLDGYGCYIIDAIETDGVKTEAMVVPADWITSREFCVVREYKTTIWEIK